MGAVGPLFGLPRLAAVRSGLLLAPGGEFAFVAFGEAVSRGVLPAATCNLLYLVRGRGNVSCVGGGLAWGACVPHGWPTLWMGRGAADSSTKCTCAKELWHR